MSNAVLAACRPLRMPPTAKAVLVCLADYANDAGECWPSIDTIAEFTCFGRTAVIGAIRWLEASGVVVADRSNGRHTAYKVIPNQYACRTGTPAEPVRLPNQTSTGGGLHQYGSRTGPVREADSNPQEPPVTPNKATPKRVTAIELPSWLTKEIWRDWCDHRKAIKAPMTERAAELSIAKLAELREQGFTPEKVIHTAIERGWRGLFAPHDRSPTPATKPSASADFRGKTYASTPISQLPTDLREAAERALRDG